MNFHQVKAALNYWLRESRQRIHFWQKIKKICNRLIQKLIQPLHTISKVIMMLINYSNFSFKKY